MPGSVSSVEAVRWDHVSSLRFYVDKSADWSEETVNNVSGNTPGSEEDNRESCTPIDNSNLWREIRRRFALQFKWSK